MLVLNQVIQDFFDTNTDLTKKYIPYHLQYKGTPSAIKTWLSKPSCPFEGRTNFDEDVSRFIEIATEDRLKKIEKDRQTKYETEFKNELSELLKKNTTQHYMQLRTCMIMATVFTLHSGSNSLINTIAN